uniref:Uncharacterized protein n=1 Tax=Arundo donax TaxID=35708 RepID=A0A0A8YJ65_ARUDO
MHLSILKLILIYKSGMGGICHCCLCCGIEGDNFICSETYMAQNGSLPGTYWDNFIYLVCTVCIIPKIVS